MIETKAITVEVSKLSLKPGDILVLKSDRNLPQHDIDSIGEHMMRIVPDGVKCAVLEPGFEFQIIESPDKESVDG